MTCRHVKLAGVHAIVCHRRKPPRIHATPDSTLDGWTLCGLGARAGLLRNNVRGFVTCKRCKARRADRDAAAAALRRMLNLEGTSL